MSFTHTQLNNPLYLSDLVEKELKGTITASERQLLLDNPDAWSAQLKDFKRRTEMQFTSSRARKLRIHADYANARLTGSGDYTAFLDQLAKEYEWRCNASRFLQQVENRLSSLKISDCDD